MRLYRHITANDVQLEAFPFKRELSMEAYLIDNEGVLALDDNVFTDVEIVDAEITLKNSQITNGTDGRIDILATYSQEFIAIVELKLENLDQSHLNQLQGYLLEREQILKKYPDILNSDSAPNPKWIGVLVGATIDSALADTLRRGYTFEGIPVAALTVQRFRGSDGSVLVTTDSYFNRPSLRDFRKYVFEGKTLGKGRLVLAVVKRFIEMNPTTTFAELQKAFPSSCQGSSGVVDTAENANHNYTASGRKRHFLDPGDLIQLEDGPVAVSSQWGIGNITRFITRAAEFDLVIYAADR